MKNRYPLHHKHKKKILKLAEIVLGEICTFFEKITFFMILKESFWKKWFFQNWLQQMLPTCCPNVDFQSFWKIDVFDYLIVFLIQKLTNMCSFGMSSFFFSSKNNSWTNRGHSLKYHLKYKLNWSYSKSKVMKESLCNQWSKNILVIIFGNFL